MLHRIHLYQEILYLVLQKQALFFDAASDIAIKVSDFSVNAINARKMRANIRIYL